MLSGAAVTYRQIMHLMEKDIAWCRICLPDNREENCMGAQAIRESIYRYGDRLVYRAYPGYGSVMIYLEREASNK